MKTMNRWIGTLAWLSLALVGTLAACGGSDCGAGATDDGLVCEASSGIQVDVALDGVTATPERVSMLFACDLGEPTQCLRDASVTAGHLELRLVFDGETLVIGTPSTGSVEHDLKLTVLTAEGIPLGAGTELDLAEPQAGVTVVAELRSMYGDSNTGGGPASPTAVYRVTEGVVRVVASGAESWTFDWSVTLENTSPTPSEGVPAIIELTIGHQGCEVEEASSGC